MAYSNNIITAPVSISDVQTAVAHTSGDLATLITAGTINKWAKYKPLKIASVIDVISEAQRRGVKYGLVPTRNTTAEGVINIATSSHPTAAQFVNAKNAATEWTYERPNGTPYRLTDFVESPYSGAGGGSGGGFTNSGYYKNTEPPLSIGDEWEISYDTLYEIMNTPLTDSSKNTDTSWVAKTVSGYNAQGASVSVYTNVLYIGNSDRPSIMQYTGWKATFGTASNIANAGGLTIPLNFLLDVCANGEDWRLGLMVFVPSNGTNVNPYDYAGVIVSRWPLMVLNSTNVADYINRFSPDLATNQLLAWKMYSVASASETTEFDCFPVVCKVANPTSALTRTDYQRTMVSPSNSNIFQVYSIPTGYKNFKIVVKKTDYSYGWKFVSIPIREVDMRTGGNVTDSTPSVARAWLRDLCLYREEQAPQTYQVSTVECTYSYVTWNSSTQAPQGNTGNYTRTEAVSNTATFTINGETYYGYIIRSGFDISESSSTIILIT